MKKVFFILFILTAVIASAQEDVPKISFPEETFDFGDILQGKIVSHEFIIKNSGNADLKILKVKPTCGCTAASPYKSLLKPNETTSVKVEFDASRREGSQIKHVYIFSNDPKTPRKRLTFTAFVLNTKNARGLEDNIPRLRLMEYRYNFGIVQMNSLTEWKGKIKNVGKKVLTIAEVKSSCSCITAYTSSKRLETGETANIIVEFRPGQRTGTLTRTLEIITDDPIDPKQSITFFAYIPKTNQAND